MQARLSMRHVREILRLRAAGLSYREIGRSLSISSSAAGEVIQRAHRAAVPMPAPPELEDQELEERIYGSSRSIATRPVPLWSEVERELRRKGVTLQLLWQEYRERFPDGYSYSQFCERFSEHRRTRDLVLRQDHRAGEKLFVDFSGDGIRITDPPTGKEWEAPLFVAVLGASSYTYAEAFADQSKSSWIDGHIHTLEFLGGVPRVWVPDNDRSLVVSPSRYEPIINPTYARAAEHYGAVILPARPGKPRDKAKVEAGVYFAQRFILAALRNQRFFSLEEANRAIARLLRKLNERPFTKMDGSRRERFEQLDRPALQPLPAARYELEIWKKCRVHPDYHVEIEKHYYSVPYTLFHELLEARVTRSTVEVLHEGKRVASHARSFVRFGHTTLEEHMPAQHRAHLAWNPARLKTWAQNQIGPATAALFEEIMNSRKHPEQGFRSCLGIMRLEKKYGAARLEAASQRALRTNSHGYRHVQAILASGLDQAVSQDESSLGACLVPIVVRLHDNVRGASAYS